MRTNFPEQNSKLGEDDTILTQKSPECETESEKDVKFPKRLKHRGRTLATIYKTSEKYPAYRLAWTVVGQRR